MTGVALCVFGAVRIPCCLKNDGMRGQRLRSTTLPMHRVSIIIRFLRLLQNVVTQRLVQNKHMLWLLIVMPFPSLPLFPLSVILSLAEISEGKIALLQPKNKIQFPNRPRPLKYQSCRYLHRSRHSVIPTCNTTFLAPQCQIDTITSAPSSATKIVSHCLLLRAVNIISWFHYSKTRIYVHRYLQFVSDELGKQIQKTQKQSDSDWQNYTHVTSQFAIIANGADLHFIFAIKGFRIFHVESSSIHCCASVSYAIMKITQISSYSCDSCCKYRVQFCILSFVIELQLLLCAFSAEYQLQ